MNAYLDQNKNFDIDQSAKSDWIKVLQDKMKKNKSVIEVINYVSLFL